MVIADWVALALIAIALALGAVFGFGKLLKFFTSGIFGIIIAVVVCYFCLGIVLSWPFVQTLVGKFNDWLYGTGSVGEFFVNIGICKIVVAIVLIAVVQLLRILCVRLVKAILEIDNIVFKVVNKVLGAIFGVAILMCLVLFFFQVMSWIGGDTYESFVGYLSGSFFSLDKICENNPLLYIFK